jgi:hypothetical protein
MPPRSARGATRISRLAVLSQPLELVSNPRGACRILGGIGLHV